MSTKPLAQQVVPGPRGAESASAEEGAIRSRDSLFHWCGTAAAISETPNHFDKISLLDAYFTDVAEMSIAPAARFFSGALFAPSNQKARIDQSIIAGAIRDITRVSAKKLTALGDLGAAAAELFAGRLPSGLSISDVDAWAAQLAEASELAARRALVRDMLSRLSAMEAEFLIKLICGQLRIGLMDVMVEDALAKAFGLSLASVREAHRVYGDVGKVALLARRRSLDYVEPELHAREVATD